MSDEKQQKCREMNKRVKGWTNQDASSSPAITCYDDLYVVRKHCFCMTGNMWCMVNNCFEEETFTISPRDFLNDFGLPGGKSALYTPEERKFFDKIYELYRES